MIKSEKTRFIMKHGVIRWGIPTAILFFIFTRLFEFGLDLSMYITEESVKDLMVNFVIFPLVGLGFGWWLWKIEETNKESLDEK